MSLIQQQNLPLSVNPLKVGQSIGASLLFLGLANCMPLQHGARGCTSFNKLFFMRHFREPIALQTTAMELTTVVMGADANVVEALVTLCERHSPAIIGLSTTGLSATQGASLQHSLHRFASDYPQFADVAIIPVETCDSQGGMETGYALALEAVIRHLVPEQHDAPLAGQVNVLLSSLMTPADVAYLQEWIASFGLTPIMLPDLADSLDGGLLPEGFTPLTSGGTHRSQIATVHRSEATLVIGSSLGAAADLLKEKTGIPDYRFHGLHGLAQCDRFNTLLQSLSGRDVPLKQQRGRRQLQDAMLDCQFRLGVARLATAIESDLLLALAPALAEVGCELVAAVLPTAPHASLLPVFTTLLARRGCSSLQIGDLARLEELAQRHDAELVIANSHAIELAQRLQVGLLPAGYPLNRHAGSHTRLWIGYEGSRQLLYQLDNLLARHQQLLSPYRSRFWTSNPEPVQEQPLSIQQGEARC